MNTVEDWLAEHERLSPQGDNAEALGGVHVVEYAAGVNHYDPSTWPEKALPFGGLNATLSLWRPLSKRLRRIQTMLSRDASTTC